jgi:hypothetical protein
MNNRKYKHNLQEKYHFPNSYSLQWEEADIKYMNQE